MGDLTTQKRAEGFRPILMMDANNDWLRTSSKTFKAFTEYMYLVNPYYETPKPRALRAQYMHETLDKSTLSLLTLQYFRQSN